MAAVGITQFRLHFRERLNALCRDRISIAELCRKSGINRQQFNKYLSGQSLPSVYNLLAIAEALDLDVTEFFAPAGPAAHYPTSPAALFAAAPAGSHPVSRGYYIERVATGDDERTMVKAISRIWTDGALLRYRRKVPIRSRFAGRTRMWTQDGFVHESARSTFIYYMNPKVPENFGAHLLHRRGITGNDLLGLRLSVGSLVSDEPNSTATYFEYAGERPGLIGLMRSCGVLPAQLQTERDRSIMALLIEAAETHGRLQMRVI